MVSVGGSGTVCEVEAKSDGAGARLDVRRRVHARAAAVVDVAEMIGVVQRTQHRRRPVHVHGGCVTFLSFYFFIPFCIAE